MKNSKNTWIFIIVVFLIAFGTVYYMKHSKVSAGESGDVITTAMAKNKPSLCDKLPTTPELAPNGKNDCIYKVARANNNMKACESYSVNGSADNCYANLAREVTDKSICANVKSPLSQGLCYGYFAQVNKNIEVCDPLTGDIHNACVSSYVSVATKVDTAFCDKNFVADANPNFKNGCYTIVALQTKSAAVCSKITGPDAAMLKEECLQAAR